MHRLAQCSAPQLVAVRQQPGCPRLQARAQKDQLRLKSDPGDLIIAGGARQRCGRTRALAFKDLGHARIYIVDERLPRWSRCMALFAILMMYYWPCTGYDCYSTSDRPDVYACIADTLLMGKGVARRFVL